MQVLILAAGTGSRLGGAANGQPKCLLDIDGRPLVLRQLDALADQGAGPVLMVVGYQQAAVREVVGNRVEYVVNERFSETNSLYSLWLAREWIKGPFLLLNSDLLFDPEILARLLEQPGNALAYDSTASRGREQTKVALRGRRVVDLGKDLPPSSARGESLGLLKFDEEGARALLGVADDLIKQDQEKAWVIEATRAVCKMVALGGMNVAGRPWVEVDSPHDLEEARTEVWPAIWSRRWRRTVYWKRTRWLAAAVAAAVIAVSGWLASSRMKPTPVDWENVAPVVGSAVSLELHGAPQRWWIVSRGDSIAAHVDGAATLRLEFRLVMPAGVRDTARYVVAVALDGAPHTWDAFTATRDSGAVLAGAAVGDRDRLEFALPPGTHTVQVALLAGHGARMLVRMRRPE